MRLGGRDEDLHRVTIEWKRPRSEKVEVIEARLLDKVQTQFHFYLKGSNGSWTRLSVEDRWEELTPTGVHPKNGLAQFEVEFVDPGGA